MSDAWLGLTATQWTAIGVVATILIGTVSILLWLRTQKKESPKKRRTRGRKGIPKKPEPSKASTKAGKPRKPLPETFLETFVVETGTFHKIVRPLKEGQRVKGLAEEISNYEFDFYIMDEEQYANFVSDRDFDPLYMSVDESICRFNKRIPHSDDWYFVFHLYTKKAPREIVLKYTVYPLK